MEFNRQKRRDYLKMSGFFRKRKQMNLIQLGEIRHNNQEVGKMMHERNTETVQQIQAQQLESRYASIEKTLKDIGRSESYISTYLDDWIRYNGEMDKSKRREIRKAIKKKGGFGA
jgi:hypothetical protein